MSVGFQAAGWSVTTPTRMIHGMSRAATARARAATVRDWTAITEPLPDGRGSADKDRRINNCRYVEDAASIRVNASSVGYDNC